MPMVVVTEILQACKFTNPIQQVKVQEDQLHLVEVFQRSKAE